jgi:hypothetical protein
MPSIRTACCRWWQQLSPRWQSLVRRNSSGLVDARGQVYGAPYRWGCSMIAYRPDRLVRRGGQPIMDWSDLLQPDLKGKVAFIDSSREFVGIAFKTLGLSFNTTAASLRAAGIDVSTVKQRVDELKLQAKLFSSSEHVRALSAGDAWAVVGWSSDLVSVAERSSSVEALAPASGTALWADIWTVPAYAKGGHMMQGPSPILPSWLEFGLMPARKASLGGLRTGASPLLLPGDFVEPWVAGPAQLQREQLQLTNRTSFLPPGAVLQRSEFLEPLDDDTVALYQQLLA